jgi:hypothetical protein
MTKEDPTSHIRRNVYAILDTPSLTGGTAWMCITVLVESPRREGEATSKEIASYLIAMMKGEEGAAAAATARVPLQALRQCFAAQATVRHMRNTLSPIILTMIEEGEICLHDQGEAHKRPATLRTFSVTLSIAQPHH